MQCQFNRVNTGSAPTVAGPRRQPAGPRGFPLARDGAPVKRGRHRAMNHASCAVHGPAIDTPIAAARRRAGVLGPGVCDRSGDRAHRRHPP